MRSLTFFAVLRRKCCVLHRYVQAPSFVVSWIEFNRRLTDGELTSLLGLRLGLSMHMRAFTGELTIKQIKCCPDEIPLH